MTSSSLRDGDEATALSASILSRLVAVVRRAWFALARALHRIVSPVVLAVLFYGVVTPFAMVARLLRPQLTLRMRPDSRAATYWIRRESGSSPMDQQF